MNSLRLALVYGILANVFIYASQSKSDRWQDKLMSGVLGPLCLCIGIYFLYRSDRDLSKK